MKKLNKLHINADKLMNESELVNLKGGGDPCTCLCFNGGIIYGYLLSETGDCKTDCSYAFDGSDGVCIT